MAPSGRIRTRSSSSTARKTRRGSKTQLKIKKKTVGPSKNNQEAKSHQNSSSESIINPSIKELSKINENEVDEDDNDVSTSSGGCSTPKAQRFRIPEIMTCPPAPKKQRVVSDCSTFRRSPIAFYAPPDLELFFYFALGGISV